MCAIPCSVILASILVWSVMTFLAGFAQNVWQLAITRIGLAIGEAGAIPSSHALVSLKFKPAQTGFLLSMLAIGGFGGMAAAPIIGGWADRKSGVKGKSVSIPVNFGGRRIIKK